jgi:membrane-bound lytic murein transglycosylase B
MFNSWRLLQLASLPALLAACAAPAAQHSPTAPPRIPSASESIRIGPAGPDLSGLDGETSELTPGGALRPDIRDFVEKLADEKGLSRDRLVSALSTARFSPTVARLIAPTAGKKVVRSWTVYRSRVVEPKRIGWGVNFWQENQSVLSRASQRFGVPSSIIVAIIGVETLYGRNMGSFRVIDALTTLAFDYPDPGKPERAAMFRDQLADFLILSIGQQRVDINSSGSFAGAIGMPQFMPGSIMRYAVDGDGDGHIDLTDSVDDAVMSVGNFLMQHGWQRGLPVFAPITLSPAAQTLADGGLTPTVDWNRLHGAGATLAPADAQSAWMERPLGVIDLPDDQDGTAQYRTATENFFAITQYNRSYFYAASVADLAGAISRRMDQ